MEIERKYLIKPEAISNLLLYPAIFITQGYLTLQKDYHTRLRLTSFNGQEEGFITSKLGSGLVREEFEEKLSLEHCKLLLSKCVKILKKERRKVQYKGFIWEVDFFPDHNLWVAEIEIPSVDTQFELPDFIDQEVTGDDRYSNIYLAKENT